MSSRSRTALVSVGTQKTVKPRKLITKSLISYRSGWVMIGNLKLLASEMSMFSTSKVKSKGCILHKVLYVPKLVDSKIEREI